MAKILIHGCNGRMGNMVSTLSADYAQAEIVAGVDRADTEPGGKTYPVYESLNDVKEDFDVIIDISSASAIDGLIAFAEEKEKAVVICTTGLSKEQEAAVKALSEKVPVLRSGNMSLGINTLIKVLQSISKTLYETGFDVDIVERHHKHKLDAPSGTALMLANAVKDGCGEDLSVVYDRSDRRMERPHEEIGISAVRGGTIVGEHEVIFAGTDEIIEIRHTALSRAVFANGALKAALFLQGREAGLYGMSDVVG